MISLCCGFQGFQLCPFHIGANKKSLWNAFLKMETSGLALKTAGVFSTLCILLLLVLMRNYGETQVSPPMVTVPPSCKPHGACMRVPAPRPASLPVFPSSFNWKQSISELKWFSGKQYASGRRCLVKNVSNSKNAAGDRNSGDNRVWTALQLRCHFAAFVD